MSYSSLVKDELSKHTEEARHCRIAELSAIISMCGHVDTDSMGKLSIRIHTENIAVARKYFTLLKKTFNINTDVSTQRNNGLNKSRTYILRITSDAEVKKLLMACRLMHSDGSVDRQPVLTDDQVIQKECCRRAYIKGAFLASGSISDPEKTYHFEIVCLDMEKAQLLVRVMASFQVKARVVKRRKYEVVYVKDGSQVVDLLNIMGAHVALMSMENTRIIKDMRNEVNRKVNCETANINKTVFAGMKQIDDIRYIEKTAAFGELSDGLKEIALLRLDYPDASLAELGEMLSKPLGKSGVNHRLKKISEIAENLRERDHTGSVS